MSRLIPVSDLRKNFPGWFSFGFMAVGAALIAKPACSYGLEKISDPQYLIGASADNYGCYPIQELAQAGVFLIGFAGSILFNAVREAIIQSAANQARNSSVNADYVQMGETELTIQKKEGVSYWWGKNTLSLHLPRFFFGFSVVSMMVAMPWIHVSLDSGVRFMNEDPDAAEAAAAQWGKACSMVIPMIMFFGASLMPVIKNQVYVAVGEDENAGCFLSSIFDRLNNALFVDHSRFVEDEEPQQSVQAQV